MLQKKRFPCLRLQEHLLRNKTISEFVQVRFASSANVSSFARRGNISGNNVSATMFPRLRAPLWSEKCRCLS